MLELDQNTSSSPATFQTAGERYFPTPELLRERMAACGVIIVDFLVAARICGADQRLPLPRRQLLEACTLTVASYEEVGKLTDVDQLASPRDTSIRYYLLSIINKLYTFVNEAFPGKYNDTSLNQIKDGEKARQLAKDFRLDYADPKIFIPTKIELVGKPGQHKDKLKRTSKIEADSKTQLLAALETKIVFIDRRLAKLMDTIRNTSRISEADNFIQAREDYNELIEEKAYLEKRVKKLSEGRD